MSDSDMSKLMVGITTGCYILLMTLSVISLIDTHKAIELPLESLYDYLAITASHIAGMMFITFLALLTLECISIRSK